MLTQEDIKSLIEAEKEVFATKDDIAGVNNNISGLQTSVDNLAKMVQEFKDEHIVVHRRLEILEAWAKKVADKLDIALPY